MTWLVLIGVLLLLLAALPRVLTNPVPPVPFGREVTADPEALRGHVLELTALDGARSFDDPEALERAGEYIRAVWQSYGFEVEEQTYQVSGMPYRNLIVRYGPADAPVVVVGAHYDVCGSQPGADDNASAVASILELARLLATDRPSVSNRLELVAFTLEEPPFFRTSAMGSAVHARSLRARGVRVVAMLCLEMVGFFSDRPGSQRFPLPGLGLLYPRTGNFIAVVGNLGGRRVTAEVKARMAGGCDLPVHSLNAPSIVPGIDFSDHWSYWREGYPAVMITDTAFYRNPNYHEISDTPDTLDYSRMAEVVRGVFAAMTTL